MRRVMLLLGWIFFSFVSGLSAADWPQFRQDALHTARVEETLPPSLDVKWSFKAAGKIVSSPSVRNDVVYFGSRDNTLYALNAASGDELWKFSAQDWIDSSPAVTDDSVYVTSRDGHLYCLNAATGEQRWAYETGGTDSSSATVVGGTVFAGSGFPNKYLYAVNAQTGAEQWRVATEQMVYASPLVTETYVVFGGNDNYIYCVQRSDGKLVWKFKALGGFYYASPALQGDRVFVAAGDFDWSIYCLDLSTGRLLWEHPVETPKATPTYVSSVAIGTENIFVVSGYGQQYLYCLSLAQGQQRWKALLGPSTRYGFSSSPVCTKDAVYVVTARGMLQAYAVTTGTKTWEYDLKAEVLSSPTIANNRLFIGTMDGTLYAFE